ncbi:MAG: homoserine O-succinyltransferase [Succinivibrionaceae bacterium]
MPIKIPDALPAANILTAEKVFIMTDSRAVHQDIRPLHVLILNLMPKKIETETQYLRKLSNTPLQVVVDLLRIDDHVSKNTPKAHLDTFYQSFQQVKDKYYDGLIITGAPLGKVPFEEVKYWDTLKEIVMWSKVHVTCTWFSCWAVQAALNIFYDLPKITRSEKLSGVYSHIKSSSPDPLIRGFDDTFLAPHSRYANFECKFIEDNTDLEILAYSDIAGVYLAVSSDRRQVYVTGHPEYDANTLDNEYRRDLNANLNPKLPVNYYPKDDPSIIPICSWRSHGYLLFANWLNYYLYQTTPYDFTEQRSV